jgi:putative MATE family efflux protein
LIDSIGIAPREEQRRKLILEGNLWRVVPLLAAPLALYALFNYFYGFFDMMVAARIGKSALASIIFIDEIKNAVTAFGVGIASGGMVLVARHLGAKDVTTARKIATTTLALSFVVSLSVVIVTTLFARPILRILNASDAMISEGLSYFVIQMVTTAIIGINACFMGMEKAKGNTMMVLYLNVFAMIIKLALTAVFAFGLDLGTAYVALATLIAQGLMMVVAIRIMFSKRNFLKISFQKGMITGEHVKHIILLSLPVFAGKFLFSIGKVAVNALAALYGTMAVATFGLAMKLSSGAGTLGQVFEEAETGIVSQNLGNRNPKRAFKTYIVSQVYSFAITVIGFILVSLTFTKILVLFTDRADTEFIAMLTDIFRFERYSIITSAMVAIISGFFIGYKLPRVVLVLNVVRLYVFRIPALWIFQACDFGHEALGYAMFISNTMTALIAVFFVLRLYLKHRIQPDF